MPSPAGHSLVGLAFAIYLFAPISATLTVLCQSLWRNKGKVAICVLIANLPDIDYLFGLGGNVNDAHHWYTHTLGWCFLLTIALWLLLRPFWTHLPCSLFLVLFALCYSHVALDVLSIDYSTPQGVMLLWPFHGDFIYNQDLTCFLNLEKHAWEDVLAIHNVKAVVFECLILFPAVVMTVAIRVAPARGNTDQFPK